MGIRLAINGLGRIGRLVLRQHFLKNKSELVDIVAVNDLSHPEILAYLIKHDSTHGLYPKSLRANDQGIYIEDRWVQVCTEKDPTKLPWKDLKIDYVVESTGLFTKLEDARKHIDAGAKKVIISAPAKGDVPTFVMGVNEEKYDPIKDAVISNASCTTNCLAPLAKVLVKCFGIEEGLMTTVHAMTATQPILDAPSKKDLRGGRGAVQNIIPASTGAAKVVGLCLPEVKGKLTGMALRVPIADVSVVDLTVRLTKSTSYDEICQKMKEASENELKGILAYCDEEVVSSDFIGSTYSTIFDAKAGIGLNSNFFKLIAWYDNEMAYASRINDLVEYMAKREVR